MRDEGLVSLILSNDLSLVLPFFVQSCNNQTSAPVLNWLLLIIRHANIRENWNFSLDQKRRRVTCPLLCVFYRKQWKVHEYTTRSWNDKNCMFPAKSWQIVIDYSVFVWREFDLFLKIRSITSWKVLLFFHMYMYIHVWVCVTRDDGN